MPLLHGAAKHGDIQAVRSAIKRCDDVDATDGHGRIPLVLAAKYGHLEIVELLIANHADVNGICVGGSNALSGEAGVSALVAASRSGRVKIVQTLIAHGADVDLGTEDEFDALFLASGEHKTEKEKMLFSAGVVPVGLPRLLLG